MVNLNVIKCFEESFKANWDLDALTDYGTTNTLTYGEIACTIEKLHILFEKAGIKEDDKIALMGKNTCSWCVAYLAAITYGAVIVPLLQDFKPNDTIHLINHSDAQFLFVSDRIWEDMDLDQMPALKVVLSLNKNYSVLANRLENIDFSFQSIDHEFTKKYPMGYSREDVHYIDKSNSCLMSINYTSGTTGFSKGVMTPANALAGNIYFGATTGQVFRGCRQVVFLPLAHAFGCAWDFLGTLACGGHAYLIGRTPSPKILIEAFQKVKPTLIFSVPLIVEKIYKKQIQPLISKAPISWVLNVPYLDDVVLSKIRQSLIDAFGGSFSQIIVGGAPLNAEVEEFFRRIHFPITVGYGMTECAPLISYQYWLKHKLFSCGRVLDGLMEAKVMNPDANGIGELIVRGENVMLGYYKNEEATKQIFTEDGWLKTGDLGYIDADGDIFIKGRSKTMLLGPSGQNIYPEEIEAKLNNMAYVMESLVLQDDDKLVALVCPDYEMADTNHLDDAGLDEAMEVNRKALNAQLPAYESISKIKVYPHEFEKTPKRSIKRFLYSANME